MPVSINSNSASRFAAYNLEKAQTSLQSSLSKLSSGKRIVQPYDDAAGEAVQLKLKAAVTRYGQVKNNIQNAVSFLQVQDGVFQTATEVVSRMGELATMAGDTSKSSSDKALYNTEFTLMIGQLQNLESEQFNGVNLFAMRQTVYTSEALNTNSAVVLASGSVISGGTSDAGVANGSGLRVMSGATTGAQMFSGGMSAITADLQGLATMRAKNGAYQSALNYSYNNASLGKMNMEAARGRIIDLDIAEESSNFARANILAQAASSMLAQANNSNSSVLQLLM
jgi:flagellin